MDSRIYININLSLLIPT